MKYKYVDDLTSDVMYIAYGKDLKEVFENSALAMFETICLTKKVKPKKAIVVETKADNASDLMVKWLSELIGAVDINEMFFSKFEVLEINEKKVKAKIYGETISHKNGQTVVKAVTRYGYKFEKTEKGYECTVVLDI